MDFRARYKFDVEKDFLGKGEFSRVYRATDTLLERVVALKFFTTNASEHSQVLDEIKKVISLEHPNLCKYYDVEVLTSRNIIGEQERTEVGIMEYLDAGDFKRFIAAHPQFTGKLLIDVLNGLFYLHNGGIVHRDLKPQNILIKTVHNKPVAKITDFRSSKLINGKEGDLDALPSSIEYIAPEQFNPSKYGINGKVSTNLDLWSFGLIVYEAIAAEPLFGSRNAGVSAEQIMTNILNENYLDKLEVVPPKYRKILKQCLVREASKRVQSAADLIPILSEGAVQSGSHVYVTQQTVAPKIVDHGDPKIFIDPKTDSRKDPEINPAIQEKVPGLAISDDHTSPGQLQDQTPPLIDRRENLQNTEALKQAASADVDVTRPFTTADNRLADETNTLDLQHDRHNSTRQRNDVDEVRPISGKKVVPNLSEQTRTAAKPSGSTIKEKRTPYPKRPVKETINGKEEKRVGSWKSKVIGLLLIVIFTALVLLRRDDDPISVLTNKPASKQVQSSAVMLPQMVEIPGSVFLMGFDGKGATDPEKPVHPVLVNDFAIGKYEVTIGEFRNFVAATGYQTTAEAEGSTFMYDSSGNSRKAAVNWRYDVNGNKVDSAQANLPVVHVSWYDAVAYCNWLSEKTGNKYRLPTEAEWEYAVMGGKEGSFFNFNGGNSLSEISWNGENAENTYHQVGSKKPNALGLYDMIGNVYEWCADWYDEHAYRSGKAENPAGPKSGSKKVIRGGSWYRDGGPEYYRPTLRFLLDPKDRGAKVGFRICASSGN